MNLRYKNTSGFTAMLLCFSFAIAVKAQSINKTKVRYSEWVIKVEESSSRQAILKSHKNITQSKSLFSDLNLWGVWLDEAVTPQEMERMLGSDSRIIEITPNYQAQWRNTPNDPDFPSQWGMQTIRMLDVWDESTGGKAPNGHDIVVAVFDDGFQVDHSDLVDNIWVNAAEIPDNGIDDDLNGYVDDYLGWNATEDNDDHRLRSHGTSVAGVIGAKGNNNNQVSGVNWDIKLMLTSGGRSDMVSLFDVVKAHEYILRQRQIYNQSNGAMGAYVVVSNYSGGAADLFPEDFPSWCDIYAALGQEGVLSVSSAPNTNTNVDEEGDLPSTCPTEFLIVTTNTDILDQKVQNSGFGPISVDLGAPGDGTFTTGINDNTDPDFSGTSASAPHVAGVIALLYSVICQDAYQTSIENPPAIANVMREAIFDGVDLIRSLDNITTTGGRLNALTSLNIILSDIGDCCEISSVQIESTSESCVGSNDGTIQITAEAFDIEGPLVYSIDGIGGNSVTPEPSFANLEPGQYTISVYDLQNQNCANEETVALIESSIDECPFGDFSIMDIRPNPASQLVEINYQIDEIKIVMLKVHDTTGKLVFEQQANPTFNGMRRFQLDVSNLPQGTYHASLIATDQISSMSFLIVR